MDKRNVLSAVVLILSVLLAVVLYVIVIDKYDKVWFEFWPVLWLSLVTFVSGIGIYASAILLEIEKNK
jgi:hypothetical protein